MLSSDDYCQETLFPSSSSFQHASRFYSAVAWSGSSVNMQWNSTLSSSTCMSSFPVTFVLICKFYKCAVIYIPRRQARWILPLCLLIPQISISLHLPSFSASASRSIVSAILVFRVYKPREMRHLSVWPGEGQALPVHCLFRAGAFSWGLQWTFSSGWFLEWHSLFRTSVLIWDMMMLLSDEICRQAVFVVKKPCHPIRPLKLIHLQIFASNIKALSRYNLLILYVLVDFTYWPLLRTGNLFKSMKFYNLVSFIVPSSGPTPRTLFLWAHPLAALGLFYTPALNHAECCTI